MSDSSRLALIKSLQEKRRSKLICYVTSDRQPPWNAQMGAEVTRPFFEHLRKLGKVEKLDVFIFSLGGDTIVPWRLATLAREFCKKLAVLVPFRAHSAATLLALGADEIVMGPLGELSPIDPNIATPFNPPHPDNPAEQKVPISVEDVVGYINLAKERAGLTNQDALVRVFEKLVDRLHPLAVGSVYRTHALIRLLAARLLGLHMKKKRDLERIPRIVDALAEKLYAHNLLINRGEAADLGLNIVARDEKLEAKMWELFEDFEKELRLGQLFKPPSAGQPFTEEAPIAVIESESLVSVFTKKIHGNVVNTPAGPQMMLQEDLSGWITTERKATP